MSITLTMTKKLKFKVEGIECTGCALDIETIMMQMEGIMHVRVSAQEETVTIEYNANEIAEKEILSAIRKLGLKVTVSQNNV